MAELNDAPTFRRFVDALVKDALPETPRKPEYVPCTYLWIVEGDTFLGSLAIRHELNDYLLNEGGHIGYSVRPSARRRGHAAAALADAPPMARELGIRRVLLTCDEDNAGSRATIEKNGGVCEDTRNSTGPYAITRHPMYVGWWLIQLGAGTLAGSSWASRHCRSNCLWNIALSSVKRPCWPNSSNSPTLITRKGFRATSRLQ